jgi:hypothetical protein
MQQLYRDHRSTALLKHCRQTLQKHVLKRDIFLRHLPPPHCLQPEAPVLMTRRYLVSTFRDHDEWFAPTQWAAYDLPEDALVYDLKKAVEDMDGISVGV